MDIRKFLQKFNEHIKYAEWGNGCLIAFPFKFYNDCCIPSMFISENETGSFTLTDNGSTMRYFENMGVDPREYADKINQICDMFDLTYENGMYKCILGEYETNLTFVQLTKFFVGISHIATVYRLS